MTRAVQLDRLGGNNSADDLGPAALQKQADLPISVQIILAGFIGMFAAIAIIVLATWVNWQAVTDFIAPTAAKARERGWQTIVEGL